MPSGHLTMHDTLAYYYIAPASFVMFCISLFSGRNTPFIFISEQRRGENEERGTAVAAALATAENRR